MAGHVLLEWLVCWLAGADGLFKIQPMLPRPAAFISCLDACRLRSGTHPSPLPPSPAGVPFPPAPWALMGSQLTEEGLLLIFASYFGRGRIKSSSFCLELVGCDQRLQQYRTAWAHQLMRAHQRLSGSLASPCCLHLPFSSMGVRGGGSGLYICPATMLHGGPTNHTGWRSHQPAGAQRDLPASVRLPGVPRTQGGG